MDTTLNRVKSRSEDNDRMLRFPSREKVVEGRTRGLPESDRRTSNGPQGDYDSTRAFQAWLAVACLAIAANTSLAGPPLPGTKALTLEGDITSQLVDGVDRFLLREIDQSVARRADFWRRDFSSVAAYNKSIEPNRKRLAHILGVRDERFAIAKDPSVMAAVYRPVPVAEGKGYTVLAARWPVLPDPDPGRSIPTLHGEGLLLMPDPDVEVVACVIAIPDADQTPEQIAGLVDGVAPESQFARRLAESGCRVLVPALVSREMQKRLGRANLTNREFVYRSAFELGRHLIGYELQQILIGVDWFAKDAEGDDTNIAVVGYGEGGMLALFAGALDTRIDGVCVSGFFSPREKMWNEPLDRNVFGLLEQFGIVELAAMVAPRVLVVETAHGPEVTLPSEGGGPAELTSPDPKQADAALTSAAKLVSPLSDATKQAIPFHTVPVEGDGTFGTEAALEQLLQSMLHPGTRFVRPGTLDLIKPVGPKPQGGVSAGHAAARQKRLVEGMDQHSQLLLRESPFVRKEFMKSLDRSSVDAYSKGIEAYRDIFRKQVVGEFTNKPLPFNTRTRQTWKTDKWTGYEVVLDVFPDVIAYGALLVPNDLRAGEKRPVVVCQHGLEGRPTDTFLDDHRAYHDFAAKLCERGFITFAPQNLYIFRDRFRTLQRKSNSIGRTLFSVIVPQHQQIVDWLKTHPNVDSERIAFYGLSYGGKSAMRIPALVTDYCLSICSADFNEWVRKNASSRHNFSYVWTGEYEIFEFDLGSTFNYAEMAALICPRPFMVERGHFDGVGVDEWVAYEFAKVRHLYAAQLGIGDRTEIEWFVGPHTINGKATYAFLHRHLNWPEPK